MKIKGKQAVGIPRSRWTQQVCKDAMQKGGREGYKHRKLGVLGF